MSEEGRRYLFEQIPEAIGERAARAMSDVFDEAKDDDPGLVARFDQQDAAINDLSVRMGRVEAAVTDLSVRMARLEVAVTDLSAPMGRVEAAVTELQMSFRHAEIRVGTPGSPAWRMWRTEPVMGERVGTPRRSAVAVVRAWFLGGVLHGGRRHVGGVVDGQAGR